jgi:hypothetical protein
MPKVTISVQKESDELPHVTTHTIDLPDDATADAYCAQLVQSVVGVADTATAVHHGSKGKGQSYTDAKAVASGKVPPGQAKQA